MAAAGRATAVKLQTDREPKFWGHVFSHVDRVHDVKESRFLFACMSPYPEGHGHFSPASRLWVSDNGAVGRFHMKTTIRLSGMAAARAGGCSHACGAALGGPGGRKIWCLANKQNIFHMTNERGSCVREAAWVKNWCQFWR